VIDTYPGTNKPIPGGVRLARLNTGYYKGKLSSYLDIAPADPGAFPFSCGVRVLHTPGITRLNMKTTKASGSAFRVVTTTFGTARYIIWPELKCSESGIGIQKAQAIKQNPTATKKPQNRSTPTHRA
jgi:hypothetical protein